MASSKTLIGAAASTATRLLNRALHTSPNPFLSPKPELMLPSLFIPQSQKLAPFHFPQPQNDVESLRKLGSEGFLYLLACLPSHSCCPKETNLHQVKVFFAAQREHTNQATSGAKGCMDSSLGTDTPSAPPIYFGNLQRVDVESLLDVLQRVDIESQHDQVSSKFSGRKSEDDSINREKI